MLNNLLSLGPLSYFVPLMFFAIAAGVLSFLLTTRVGSIVAGLALFLPVVPLWAVRDDLAPWPLALYVFTATCVVFASARRMQRLTKVLALVHFVVALIVLLHVVGDR